MTPAGTAPRTWRVLGSLKMLGRALLVFAWTMLLLPIQLILIGRNGQAKRALPLRYWSGVAKLIHLDLNVIGTPADASGRPVVFVSNHSSWLDIIALGAVLPGCFIAKGEIASWPLISWVANAGRTIFVSRSRHSTAREREALESRLEAGDNLILFPEGTTSDGARVMPFRSSFLAIAESKAKPLVQPVTIVYDRLDWLPVCRRNRPLISWYGDMDIGSHYARVGQHELRATIIIDKPIDPDATEDGKKLGRKALSATIETRIGDCAAAIRQGRLGQRRSVIGSVPAGLPAARETVASGASAVDDAPADAPGEAPVMEASSEKH